MSRHLDPSEPLELSLKPDFGYPPPDLLFKTAVLRKATIRFVPLAHDWSKCVKFSGVICIYMLGTNEKLKPNEKCLNKRLAIGMCWCWLN